MLSVTRTTPNPPLPQIPRIRFLSGVASGEDADVATALDERAQAIARETIAKSVKTYASAIRCWMSFVTMLGLTCFLSPPEDVIIQYIAIFRNGDSAAQYLKTLKWVCVYCRYPTPWAVSPAVKQILNGSKKLTRQNRVKRAKVIFTWEQISRLVTGARSRNELEVATVMVLSTSFMFRIPSECIPLCIQGAHSTVTALLDGGRPALKVTLASRKNLQSGSVMVRRCVCGQQRNILCPVHALQDYLHSQPRTGRLFSISAAAFIKVVRDLISSGSTAFEGIVSTDCTSHVFRRSSANELMRRGRSLGQIMHAGQWGGGGFLSYLLKADVDAEAAFDCMVAASDSDEEPGGKKRTARRLADRPWFDTVGESAHTQKESDMAVADPFSIAFENSRERSPSPEIARDDFASIFRQERPACHPPPTHQHQPKRRKATATGMKILPLEFFFKQSEQNSQQPG